jgi:regulatory protein
MAPPSPEQRRPPGPVTPAYLQRAALAYLERFASSADNLRRVLTRKVRRRCRLRGEEPEEFLALVDEVVRRSLSSGLVDDRRYAEGRVASLRRRGGSARLIGAKLAAKGIFRDVAAAAIGDDEKTEREAAWALARRRRLGPYRAGERDKFREKDLTAMARAGFGFALARSVIDAERPQG